LLGRKIVKKQSALKTFFFIQSIFYALNRAFIRKNVFYEKKMWLFFYKTHVKWLFGDSLWGFKFSLILFKEVLK